MYIEPLTEITSSRLEKRPVSSSSVRHLAVIKESRNSYKHAIDASVIEIDIKTMGKTHILDDNEVAEVNLFGL